MSGQRRSPAEMCGQQLAATVDQTFGEQTDVYRVSRKIFALLNRERNVLTIKTPLDEGEALRSTHSWAHTAYYMNKRHWTTLDLAAGVPADELKALITESYQLVFESLSKKTRAELRDRFVDRSLEDRSITQP